MRRELILPILAFVVAGIMVFGHLGRPPLVQPDEGRNAEVAREMAVGGSWLIPTLNGLAYLDKPAFFFDLVVISFRFFGGSEAAARLPSALFALGLLAMLFSFCRHAYGARTAALAVMILVTSPIFFVFARAVIFDMALTFFVSAAILAGAAAEDLHGRSRSVGTLMAAVAAALATLVKGPVGLIVPSLVLGAFFIADRRPAAIGRLVAPRNVLVFVAIVLSWFLAVVRRHPDFLYYGLVEESLARFVTPAFHRGARFYYYLPVLFGAALTWTVMLPESVVALWRSRRSWSRADRLFVVWAVTVPIFFSLSRTKHPGYVLPGVVATAVLLARAFDRAIREPRAHEARLVLRGTIVLAVAGAALAGLLAWERVQPESLAWLVAVREGDSEWLRPALLRLVLSVVLAAALALAARFRRDARLAFACHLVFPLSLILVNFDGLAGYAEGRSVHALSKRLATLPGTTEIACLHTFPAGLPFYLERLVTVITDDGETLRSNYVAYRLRTDGRWPASMVRSSEREAWLSAREGEVLLLAESSSRQVLAALAAERGVEVEALAPGYWGARLPAPGRTSSN